MMTALVFGFVILGSVLFIAGHANHDCAGEDCAVCAELAQCCRQLQTLGTAARSMIAAAAACFLAVLLTLTGTAFAENHTLISWKVELLN